MLPFLHGFIFLMWKHTASRITTTKTRRAATTGIQNESKKREKNHKLELRWKTAISID